ncbi:ATP-dependent RNA helicase SrmB [Aeromonas simiae]|uniref:ATP-dependent RNA helicase SrmB n=1 Tax=Aeromonas simiae TaxID=218936 RepID=UPI0005A78E8C|nr:ATP-dependent RNA helicase SrmB [Aeromonas simiae]MDO2949194.1 ATP-dependent RNA helicase SrmB [Aeromonas simiae]MDO2951176.1 ATP-dependent RNA helicase SrmB [Aeromonas simiae]MDO2956412.1 ATP-dependent RNA helicase SrmB [Aeromonas simiae]
MSMSFDDFDLHPALNQALADMGFTRPTTIQQMVLEPALDGRDILASAPTGTGKTAGFLLPALQHLLDFPRRKPGPCRVLVLTPTRELALQVTAHAKALAAHTSLAVETIIGGVSHEEQRPAMTRTTDIVVATPGRLLEYINAGEFESDDIEILVLDEADRMLDMGFIDDVGRIVAEARYRKHTLLFSATLEGAGLTRFANEILKEPVELHAEPPRSERRKITQWIHLADDAAHKLALLTHILRDPETKKAIIFVKTRERLAELAGQLQTAEIPCAWIRGEMEQEKRVEAIRKFSEGDVPFLIATDVAARGIDLPNVSHVINYDMPYSADVYVHRIGRTGRAGNRGCAISLTEAHDMAVVAKIERYTEERLKRRVIDELRPKHKEAKVPTKKKKPKEDKKKSAKKKGKKR